MNLLKLLGFGVLIWDVVFITDAVLNSFDILPILITQTIFIIIVIVTYLLSENLEITSVKEILKYGFAWTAVMMFLDVVVAACCLDWFFLSEYSTWVNYSIVLITPIITVKTKQTINSEDAS